MAWCWRHKEHEGDRACCKQARSSAQASLGNTVVVEALEKQSKYEREAVDFTSEITR